MNFLRFRRLEEGPTITLTEKQAQVCRSALWFARTNDFPEFGVESLDFSETLAFLHRRLSPQYSDYSARLISEADQARAALSEVVEKGQQT